MPLWVKVQESLNCPNSVINIIETSAQSIVRYFYNFRIEQEREDC